MITLLDTITPGSLKGTPVGDAYAGYVGGHWPDFAAIKREYPGHFYLSYAVAPGEVADFCDCERGDFRPEQVVPWLREMHGKGIWRPGCYADADTLVGSTRLLDVLARSMPRQDYRVIVANWNGKRDIPDYADGHQYADHGPHGENYDMTVVRDDFFPHHVTNVARVWHTEVRGAVTFNPHTGGWEVESLPAGKVVQ